MVTEDCWRLAAWIAPKCAPTVYLPYRLELGDGRVWIPCRDAHQADLLRGLWRAARTAFCGSETRWVMSVAP